MKKLPSFWTEALAVPHILHQKQEVIKTHFLYQAPQLLKIHYQKLISKCFSNNTVLGKKINYIGVP